MKKNRKKRLIKKREKEKEGKKLNKKGKGGRVVELKKVQIKKEKKVIKKNKEVLNKIWVDVLLKDSMMRKWLVREIGEHAIEVIKYMEEEITDEDLAKKTNLRPSDVRTILNRLHAHGLAQYIRKRDRESGWYSYIWSLMPEAAKDFYEGFKKIVEETDLVFEKEGEFFYSIIDGKKKIYTFEEAYAYGFKCPVTGRDLKYLEKNKETKEETKKEK